MHSRHLVTSERAERVLSYLTEKYEYSRPGPARPGPITLFKALYLRNRMSDRQAVFFDEYHLDGKVVWHGYHIASMPVSARGACQTWDTLDDPQNTLPQKPHNGWTDWAETWYTARCSAYNAMSAGHFLGVSARAHVHTPLLYLENGWTDCADIWHVVSGQLVMRLSHVYGVSPCTCARARLTSISGERLNRLRLDLACS